MERPPRRWGGGGKYLFILIFLGKSLCSYFQAKIREEFSKLDTDKSGYISKDEMLTVISGSFTGDKQAEAQRCVAELDVDKDGKVSYPEFLLVMKYKKA